MKFLGTIPVILAAEAASTNDWKLTLLNYGIAGVMLGWFMWKDNRDSTKQDQRHKENLEQQQKIESAFRTTTTAVITAVSALQNVDESYSRLLKKIEAENTPK